MRCSDSLLLVFFLKVLTSQGMCRPTASGGVAWSWGVTLLPGLGHPSPTLQSRWKWEVWVEGACGAGALPKARDTGRWDLSVCGLEPLSLLVPRLWLRLTP